ncbi:MAG: hypothetical protein JRC86_05540 [Deltaproteobacteria bacterium]|nr:hypothetical protein [Deltaproteobacteria bacterium]
MDKTMYGDRRREKRGWSAAGKQMTFVMYQRNDYVMPFLVPDRKIDTLIPLMFQHSKPWNLYYSDDWHAHTRVSIKGVPLVVRKERGMPKAKSRDHINSIEGF